MIGICSRMLAGLGEFVRDQFLDWRYAAAVLGTLVVVCLNPSHWRRTIRQVFARQIMFTGVESTRFIVILAFLVGISVVVQAQLWTGRVGQSQMLGPLLVVVVVRELGSLFANFVIIVKSGSAMATEMGIKKINGEVRVLEAQGIDPLLFLVMPRVLGLAVSAFCLTVLFIVVALLTGYLFGYFIGHTSLDPLNFVLSVAAALAPVDVTNVLAKSFIPAMITGVICSTEGLSVTQSVIEVPLAARRALGRSLGALFVITAVISLLTYL